MSTSTSVQVSPPRSSRQSISPAGTTLLRSQRSWRLTTLSQLSNTSAQSVKRIRSKYREVSARDTLTVRQKPLNRTPSHGRRSRARANAPMNAEAQQVAPRNSTKTDGSFAASPAMIWVSQLFTWIASCVARSWRLVPPDTATVPAAAPSNAARRARIRPLPTSVPRTTPPMASQVRCALASTQPVCWSETGYSEASRRYRRSAAQPPRKRRRRRSIGGNSARPIARGSMACRSASGDRIHRLVEQLFDRHPRVEMCGAHARDRELAEDRVPARPIALVGVLAAHQYGLGRDRRFAERARRTHPRSIERRGDEEHRRAAPQPRQRLDQRLRDRVRPAHRDLSEVLHELAELLRPAVGVQDLRPHAARDEPAVAVLVQGLGHDRGGHRDGALLGGRLTLPAVPVPLEVEIDPEVGRLVELELLDLQHPMAHRRRPMDPVHRVAGLVLTDAHDHGSRLERPLAGEDVALEERSGQLPERQRQDLRIHEDERLGRHAFDRLEETEGIAGPKDDRAEMEPAAAQGPHDDLPAAGRAAHDREHAARERLGPVRPLGDLEPELPQAVRVHERVAQLDLVAEVSVGLAEAPRDAEALERQPRGDPHRGADEEHEVREVAEELDAARDGRDEKPEPEDREVPGAHALRPAAPRASQPPPARSRGPRR